MADQHEPFQLTNLIGTLMREAEVRKRHASLTMMVAKQETHVFYVESVATRQTATYNAFAARFLFFTAH
ncbi:MAG: hypothetical protein NNA18_04755 [Nitrospira sp.]|nr:hypothetical protein [Nitrospira sp.]